MIQFSSVSVYFTTKNKGQILIPQKEGENYSVKICTEFLLELVTEYIHHEKISSVYQTINWPAEVESHLQNHE